MHSLRNRHFVVLDLGLLACAAVVAFLLRLDANTLRHNGDIIVQYLVVSVPVRLLVFLVSGMYTRFWRYASVEELALIAAATGLSTLVVAVTVILLLPWFTDWRACPRSIPFIDGLLVLFAVGTPRFAARMAWQRRRRPMRQGRRGVQRRVLIMGAGDAGKMLVQEMRVSPQLGLMPVGFVDDDASKHGMQIHGLRVLGDRREIPHLVRAYKAQEVVIAMPSAPGTAVREVLEICEKAEVPASIIPGLYDILSGTVAITQVREVQIEDLLQRKPVIVDPTPVEEMVRGARVLVTGAGGSIGSELCRQIARCGPETLILLGHGEHSIFRIANELCERWPTLRLESVIADVRDEARLRQVISAHRPAIVCHAAAHKHVPMMEANVVEAVTNNVLGTRALLRACAATDVERFVLISTDKVVEPTSVMGVTKRVAELLVQAAARQSGRRYVAVRFGNVLGSRGSVVPYFQRQIARGGPVTVTHPEMRRYFMTIPEAVQLVLQAAALGQGGEVFILDMGEQIKIVDLAVDLIRLTGLRPYVSQLGAAEPVDGKGRDWDIEVVFTGLRPGEKLYEELIVEGEKAAPTCHEKILISRNGCDGLPCPVDLESAVEALGALARAGDAEGCRVKLREIVPGYRWAGEDQGRVLVAAYRAELAVSGD